MQLKLFEYLNSSSCSFKLIISTSNLYDVNHKKNMQGYRIAMYMILHVTI